MSFLYPFTVKVERMPISTDTNDESYEGRVPPLTLIASNLAASIQFKTERSRPTSQLPQDVTNDAYWNIFIRKLPAGAIMIRDVITDNLGRSFEVVGDYWNSLGYNVLAKRLST